MNGLLNDGYESSLGNRGWWLKSYVKFQNIVVELFTMWWSLTTAGRVYNGGRDLV